MLNKEEIVRNLNDIILNNKIFAPIVLFIKEEILYKVDILKSEYINQDPIVFNFKATDLSACRIQFCFWIKDGRFSFFIEDREIIDDYFENNQEVEDEINTVRAILSNEIEKHFFYNRRGKLKKIVYKYFLENKKPIEETIILKLNLFDRFNKIIINKYSAWL